MHRRNAMPKMKRKMSAKVEYLGFGFPVTLHHVPMVYLRGTWTPDVNYEHLQRALLRALAGKPARLSGDEVHFIRLAAAMTLQEFAKRFGVTHPAVMKWERAGSRSTSMGWSTEKDIRLDVISRLAEQPSRFLKLYRELEQKPTRKAVPLALDVTSVA
jgi:hypothetical protein